MRRLSQAALPITGSRLPSHLANQIDDANGETFGHEDHYHNDEYSESNNLVFATRTAQDDVHARADDLFEDQSHCHAERSAPNAGDSAHHGHQHQLH